LIVCNNNVFVSRDYFDIPRDDSEVVEWIGQDLLSLLDDLIYYPHDFPEEDGIPFVSGSGGGLRPKLPKVVVPEGDIYPGTFVPKWLGSFFVEKNTMSSSKILKNVVGEVCSGGVTSIVSMYWILKTFSDEVVYSNLPRCLTAYEVNQILAFLTVILAIIVKFIVKIAPNLNVPDRIGSIVITS
jgi:hypothetical protein